MTGLKGVHMPGVAQHWLYKTHQGTAILIQAGNRLLASVLLLGGLFAIGCTGFLNFLQKPEQPLHLQAFIFNQAEFAQAERGESGLNNLRKAPQRNVLDPNWDGALAGAGLGWSAGQSIPVLGIVIGPVLGAIVGYHLDERV